MDLEEEAYDLGFSFVVVDAAVRWVLRKEVSVAEAGEEADLSAWTFAAVAPLLPKVGTLVGEGRADMSWPLPSSACLKRTDRGATPFLKEDEGASAKRQKGGGGEEKKRKKKQKKKQQQSKKLREARKAVLIRLIQSNSHYTETYHSLIESGFGVKEVQSVFEQLLLLPCGGDEEDVEEEEEAGDHLTDSQRGGAVAVPRSANALNPEDFSFESMMVSLLNKRDDAAAAARLEAGASAVLTDRERAEQQERELMDSVILLSEQEQDVNDQRKRKREADLQAAWQSSDGGYGEGFPHVNLETAGEFSRSVLLGRHPNVVIAAAGTARADRALLLLRLLRKGFLPNPARLCKVFVDLLLEEQKVQNNFQFLVFCFQRKSFSWFLFFLSNWY